MKLAHRWILGAICLELALLIFYHFLPKPTWHGDVLDFQIQQCEPLTQVSDETIHYWDQRIGQAPWATPRSNWREDTKQLLKNDPGVILNGELLRHDRILEKQTPWNKGKLYAEGWKTVNEQKTYYARYAGGSCADYRIGTQAHFYVDRNLSTLSRSSQDWPPLTPPLLVDRDPLEAVPTMYQSLLNN